MADPVDLEALDAVCGQPDLGPGMGCGERVTRVSELYRCGTCDLAFHKRCLVTHFGKGGWALPTQLERLAQAQEHLRRVVEESRDLLWAANEALSHLNEYVEAFGNGDHRDDPEDTTPREAWTRARDQARVLSKALAAVPPELLEEPRE